MRPTIQAMSYSPIAYFDLTQRTYKIRIRSGRKMRICAMNCRAYTKYSFYHFQFVASRWLGPAGGAANFMSPKIVPSVTR